MTSPWSRPSLQSPDATMRAYQRGWRLNGTMGRRRVPSSTVESWIRPAIVPIEALPDIMTTLECGVRGWSHFNQETKAVLMDEVRSAHNDFVRAAGVVGRLASMMDARHAAGLHWCRVELLSAARQWEQLSEAIATARRAAEEAGEHDEDEIID